MGGGGWKGEGWGDDRVRSTVLKLMILLVTTRGQREREKKKDGRIGPDGMLKKRMNLDFNVCLTELYLCTANEGPVRIQYKYLVPIYVFPEMKLRVLIFSKTES